MIQFGNIGGMDGAAGKAMPYLNEAMDVSKKYMSPYIERGERAAPILEREFGRMSSDPAAMLEKFMGSYKPSSYYKTMQDRLGQSISNTAAAGGMRGSPSEQGKQQELTNALLSKDMQQFLSNVMGIHSRGLSGEQNLYQTGFGGARGLSEDLSNILGTQAQLAFQQERENQKSDDDMLGSIMSAFGGLIGGGGGGLSAALML